MKAALALLAFGMLATLGASRAIAQQAPSPPASAATSPATPPTSAATANAAARSTDASSSREWQFEVRLDGRPIGTHRFVVRGREAEREVESNAQFDVKLLGLTVYRYRHQARERWAGDCLQSLQSQTDDDGQPQRVDLRREPAAAAGSTAASASGSGAGSGKTPVPSADRAPNPLAGPDGACVMSFAYWHPKLRQQTRLLNPQTGLIEDVRFERLPDATLAVGGRDVPANRWRLSTPKQELTLWYRRDDSAGGNSGIGGWVGLDARVKGDRVLTYRLP